MASFLLSDFLTTGYENDLKVIGNKHDVIGIRVYDKMDMQLPEAGLIQVEDATVRAYYEHESAACNWSKRDLERQIATQYYERILSSKDKQALIESTAKTNTPLGLVLCSEKNATVARYSVLHGSQQLFASKYLMVLPSEEQLGREIERQRALIEDRMQLKNELAKERNENV